MKWTRTIDSAQRRITIEAPHSPSHGSLQRVVLHIQGIDVYEGQTPWKETWPDMEDRGISEEGEKPLSIWQRLKRQEARAGALHFQENNTVDMTFWSNPRLTVRFNLADEDEAQLFRECEIMVLSAGFHFRTIGAEEREYKTL